MNDLDTFPLIASEEVRKNFRKSILLIAVIVGLIFAASWYIGSLLDDVRTGLIIGAVVTGIVIPVQILTAKWAILAMAGGRAAEPDDPRERRALHIVEGLALSAGLSKTPDLYIIPSKVPNAFASGLNESGAFIGVTEGLLEMMDDQELEGVIAHEVGHIIHRDIMLNQLVVALISALLILAFIIERIGIANLYSGNSRKRSDRDSGGGIAILVIVLLALLIRPLAALLGSLLQMGISRQREYAADAAAVRLCSYNEGLARALEKLGSKDYSQSDIQSLGGKELACMYINFPGGELFSTHPPIAERVRRLRNMY